MNVDRGLQMLTTELQRAKMDARERCDSGQDVGEMEARCENHPSTWGGDDPAQGCAKR